MPYLLSLGILLWMLHDILFAVGLIRVENTLYLAASVLFIFLSMWLGDVHPLIRWGVTVAVVLLCAIAPYVINLSARFSKTSLMVYNVDEGDEEPLRHIVSPYVGNHVDYYSLKFNPQGCKITFRHIKPAELRTCRRELSAYAKENGYYNKKNFQMLAILLGFAAVITGVSIYVGEAFRL